MALNKTSPHLFFFPLHTISSHMFTHCCESASMILYIKLARQRTGRPRFSFPSSFTSSISPPCCIQDTTLLCWLVFCLYYHSLLHQQHYDSTNNISTITSTRTKLLLKSQTLPVPGRIILIFLAHRTGESRSILYFLTSSSMEIQRTTTPMARCLSMMLC